MIKYLNKLFTSLYFPVSLKYISLVAYILLIAIGFMANSNDAAILKQLRNTNLGNLIVWSYWWPIIIILAISFGRIWCMICPVEIITTFFAKIGMRKKRPKWLLSGWVITVFYMVILFFGIQGIAIHRNPTFMSLYLLTIVGVSILVGSIYEKNTFCRYVCPVGYLLGLYSRLSFFGWRVKDSSVCNNCKDKSCIQKEYQYNLNYKSCGVDLYPANINDNSDCILCAGCLKTCDKYQSEQNIKRPNPQLTNIGFANDLFKLKTLKMAEFVFVLVVSGFVIYEIWAEWSVSKKLLLYIPNTVYDSLSINNNMLFGIIKSLILFILIPLAIWLIPFVISRIVGASIKLKDYFLVYGIAFIPIMAAAHLSKAVLKVTSRIPYFEHLSDDISGISTAQKIIDKEIVIHQNSPLTNFVVSLLLSAIMIGGIWLSIKVVKRINQKQNTNAATFSYYLIPIVYGSIFMLMILAWRWLN